jgi:16S rRNA (cytosine1402-N4)-methyltransferase
MRDEVVALIGVVPPGVVVDATVGGGGHAAAILSAHPHLRLLGLDRDDDALVAATANLEPFGDRVTLRKARFDSLAAHVAEVSEVTGEEVVGVLFDLGVSSPQLDRPERGFSYHNEGPLDMRMDRTAPRTAADLVNDTDEAELARIIRRYGDERFARRIAAAIVTARSNHPIESTTELADVVASAYPAPARRQPGHPARRTFQALRIALNDELEVLRAALDQALAALAPTGRCLALSYHSGEHRIVKDAFRAATVASTVTPVRPMKRLPTADEVARNPRASAAVLRTVEKLEQPEQGAAA